uniref:Testis expressed 13B n=1 Tax=Mandrillus leucophaeus TaxID=9568 RepID=A0A2K5Y732_MANLE
MALRPEDPSSGIRHSNVVAFINEKMARHTKGPEFYLENISLSWEEVEDKLWAILEDSEVPSEVKEACTWGSLALGVRFAHRQGQLQNRRVQWLQGFAKLHRSAAMVLASNLTELKEQQEMECNKATFQLRITQTSLAEAQRERDMLRWKLLHAELASPQWQGQATVFPGLATARGDWTEGAGEQEKEAVAAAGAAEGEGEETYAEAGPAPEEALQGLGGGFRHPLGAGAGKLHLWGAEGAGSQVSTNSPVLLLWAWVHSLTAASSCPALYLIHILITMPFVRLLSHTHYTPFTSKGHSTGSNSDAFQLGGL